MTIKLRNQLRSRHEPHPTDEFFFTEVCFDDRGIRLYGSSGITINDSIHKTCLVSLNKSSALRLANLIKAYFEQIEEVLEQ